MMLVGVVDFWCGVISTIVFYELEDSVSCLLVVRFIMLSFIISVLVQVLRS